ncbi:unnamed protein product [Arctogadus glacialis]
MKRKHQRTFRVSESTTIPLIKLNSSLAVRRLEYHQEMDDKASERKTFKVEERGFTLERIGRMTNRMAFSDLEKPTSNQKGRTAT